jgi:hypothetical protein
MATAGNRQLNKWLTAVRGQDHVVRPYGDVPVPARVVTRRFPDMPEECNVMILPVELVCRLDVFIKQ